MRVQIALFFSILVSFCSAQVQIVSTYAGGAGPLDGVGAAALLSSPWQIVIKDTVVYISDRGFNALRKMNLKSKRVTTLLTNQLDIAGMALSPTGDTLYFATRHAQSTNHVINLYIPSINQLSQIDTLPDAELDALICDRKGRLLIGGAGHRIILRNLDGSKKVIAGKLNEAGTTDGLDSLARFNKIASLALSTTEDTLFISDRFNSRLRRLIRSTKMVTTLSVPVFAHRQLAFNRRKDTLLIANSGGHTIVRYAIKTGVGSAWCGLNSIAGFVDASLSTSRFNFPMGIVRSDSGWVVCDNSNRKLRLISFSGKVKTIAGAGLIGDGIGIDSRFISPYDIVKHPKKDTIYITDQFNHAIRQIDLRTKRVKNVAGNGVPGNINGIGENAFLNRPVNMAISQTGDSLYFTEPFSNRIKLLLTKTREVKLLAGADANGYLDTTLGRFAKFHQPQDIALKGNTLYVADARNHRIRAVNITTSKVSTYAGSGSLTSGGFKDSTLLNSRFNRPYSLEWIGNKLFIGEESGLRIRVLYPDSGTVKVWAGSGNIGTQDGFGIASRFFSIQKLSYDPLQNTIFVAGALNVGQLRTVGVNSPVVKTFVNATGLQDGFLSQSKFTGPEGVYVDVANKKYFIADATNNRIRSIQIYLNNAPRAKVDTVIYVTEDEGEVIKSDFATNLNSGILIGDTLQKFTFSIDPNASFIAANIDTLGRLTLQTTPDSNGVFNLRILQKDNGGISAGGVDTAVYFAKLRITPVNDAPTFNIPESDSARQDLPREKPGFLSNPSPGPWDERNQTILFSIDNNQPSFFLVQPYLENGTLKYTPNPSALGVVNARLKAKDNGGLALNGIDSTLKNFTILLVDPTSIEDLKQNLWIAYPNPVQSELRFLNFPEQISIMAWFNTCGQKVADSEVKLFGNEASIQVPKNLKGIYQLRAGSGSKCRNLRIVVQ